MKLLGEYKRQQMAELLRILEINKNRLDPKQFKELEEEIKRKIEVLNNETIKF